MVTCIAFPVWRLWLGYRSGRFPFVGLSLLFLICVVLFLVNWAFYSNFTDSFWFTAVCALILSPVFMLIVGQAIVFGVRQAMADVSEKAVRRQDDTDTSKQ
ncbi:MAG: hypothetical protein R3C49_19740 [Planctomycetaceae bacterium]